MFLKEPNRDSNVLFMQNSNKILQTVLSIAVFFTVTAIFYIEPLLEWISMFVEISGY